MAKQKIKLETKPCYTVYVLKSLTTGKLYTGYTSDMVKRLKAHNSGRGGRFTKLNKPLELVYSEEYEERIVAIRRERELKTGKGRYFVKKLLKKQALDIS